MKKIFIVLTVCFVAAAVNVLLFSCGSGGSGSGGGFTNESSSPGNVVLFVTDDLGTYRKVRVTINDVRLMHMGSSASCDILEDPVELDITDLSSVLQLLDVTSCPSINYNRIVIELDKRTVLTDAGNISSSCNLATYKNEQGGTNTLQCGATCTVNMSGAVNVQASKTSNVAIDFDLKEFEVDHFGQPNCSLTMKVFPLNSADFDKKRNDGFREGISGLISNVDTVKKTFTLTADSGTFTVTYDDINATGIDDLLALAVADQLEVRVESLIIDLDTRKIAATALIVEADGAVSALNSIAGTFTLTYQTNKTMFIDYLTADVEGSLLNGSQVEVKLKGFELSRYLADEVEVK